MTDTYTVRASSWGSLFDCAYKWEGTQLLGITKPAGMRALLGSAIHASTAAFDQGRVDLSGVSIDESASVLIDTIHNPDWEVDRSADDLTGKDAERTGLALHNKYCTTISPRFEYSSVELKTKPFDIYCGNRIIIRLTGRMDRSRLISVSDKNRIADLKSGANAVQKGVANTKGHGAQVGAYSLLAEHTTGKPSDDVAEIIGLKTKGRPEVEVSEIKGTRKMMVGSETPKFSGLIEIAAQMFRTGLFPPNPGSLLCNPKYCARWGQCPYHL